MPWLYLVVLIVAGCASTVLAVVIAHRVTRTNALEALRTI
jgi:hypothetical protein